MFFRCQFARSFENREKHKNGGEAVEEPPHVWCWAPVLCCSLNVDFSTPGIYTVMYISVHLEWNFTWNSCSHLRPSKNEVSACNVRCQKMLNTEGGSRKIWRQLSKQMKMATLAYMESTEYFVTKSILKGHLSGKNYAAVESNQVTWSMRYILP